MSDQICMMTRESPGMKGRQSGTNSSSANGYEFLLDPNVQVFSQWFFTRTTWMRGIFSYVTLSSGLCEGISQWELMSCTFFIVTQRESLNDYPSIIRVQTTRHWCCPLEDEKGHDRKTSHATKELLSVRQRFTVVSQVFPYMTSWNEGANRQQKIEMQTRTIYGRRKAFVSTVRAKYETKSDHKWKLIVGKKAKR